MQLVCTPSSTNHADVAPAVEIANARAYVDLDSRRLFGAAQEVRIHHHGQEYRLRQTRNGKLILTK